MPRSCQQSACWRDPVRPLTVLGHRTGHAAKQIVSARTNPFRLHCGLMLVAASPASADAALPLPRHIIRR